MTNYIIASEFGISFGLLLNGLMSLQVFGIIMSFVLVYIFCCIIQQDDKKEKELGK